MGPVGKPEERWGRGARHGQSLELADFGRPKLLLLGWQRRKHLPVPRWVGAEDLES